MHIVCLLNNYLMFKNLLNNYLMFKHLVETRVKQLVETHK